MLHGVAAHYFQHRKPPTAALLHDIDTAIAAVTRCGTQDISDPLLRLVGIRRGLFPDAPPYVPQAAPPSLRDAA
jgi:hypothetical protein